MKEISLNKFIAMAENGATDFSNYTIIDNYKGVIRTKEAAIDGKSFEGATFMCNMELVAFNKCSFVGAVIADMTALNCKFNNCDFSNSSLLKSSFFNCDFLNCNFAKTKFNNCALTQSRFEKCNFTDCNFINTSVYSVDFSGSYGILRPSEWLLENGEEHPEGYVFYKVKDAYFKSPSHWDWSVGSYLEEEVNFDRTYECACGVNFGTWDSVKGYVGLGDYEVWKVLIEWRYLSDVVVPLTPTMGARTSKLKLLEFIV